MTDARGTSKARPDGWGAVAEVLGRPYPVSVSLILFVALVPFYLFIPAIRLGSVVHVPETAADRLVPVQPPWALVYAAVYLFLIILPVLVVRQREHIQRTISAYLTVWLTAYACFIVYPTVAPRPAVVMGQGFAAWWLGLLYAIDPPYNCLPSLHVAHSFVSALTVGHVHRQLGFAAVLCATLVAVSTLFAKQHYLLDVLAGIALAAGAWWLFLRNAREEIDDVDRRAAPRFALVTIGIVSLGLVGLWATYVAIGGT